MHMHVLISYRLNLQKISDSEKHTIKQQNRKIQTQQPI